MVLDVKAPVVVDDDDADVWVSLFEVELKLDVDLSLCGMFASVSSPSSCFGSWGRNGCVQYNIFGPWNSQK